MNTLKKRLIRFDLSGLWVVFWAAFTLYYYWLYWGGRAHSGSWFILGGFALASSTAVLASYVLWSIGYFDSMRIVPRKSDYLLLFFSMGIAGGAMAFCHTVIFGGPHSELLRLVLSLPVVSAVFFAGYRSFTRRIAQVRKRRVTLRLRPEETEEFMQTLEEVGLSKEIEILSSAQVLSEFAQRHRRPNVDLIVISRAGSRDMQADRFLLRAHIWGIPILDRRTSMAAMTGRVSVSDIDLWSFVSSANPQTAWIRFGRLVQELLEPALAMMMLIAFSPLFLLVALMIKLTSPGPVLYSQRRTGHMGRIFMLYKFRSMRTDSEAGGYQWAQKGDTRITPVGKFIRKTRLDELPQLWNVVKRDMCFVGPRPERPEIYRDLRAKIPLFSLRTDARPGITGWAQVNAGYAASIEESEIKLEHDLYYIQHMSMRLDLVILISTVKVMLFGNEYIQPRTRKKYTPRTRLASGVQVADDSKEHTI